MYFAKARKQMEEQDMREVEEKLEKYLRTDTARVQLPQQQGKSARSSVAADEDGCRKGSRGEFRPEELPDGAFVSPKHTPASQVSPAKTEIMTVSRPAEYIGSFSVTGTDEDARARQVEVQLESLQSVTKSKKVILTISLDGIKVSSGDGRSLYMFHELKRISYATCDPEHRQFSFLAREKQMNVQYCHAFVTETAQQAEELNLIIGNAFKMAYTQQRERQPTFHELIEAQVAEQQAKFREIEIQAQVELQRKLAEIARPTPLNEQAIQRMGQRKMLADEELIVSQNKLWARHAVEQVQHRISLHEAYFSETRSVASQPANLLPNHAPAAAPVKLRETLRQESSPAGTGTRSVQDNLSQAHKNVFKHKSAPLFSAQSSTTNEEPLSQGENVPSTVANHPLSAQVLRVSLENKREGKFKGSPVTALKDEIDRLVDRRFIASQMNGLDSKPAESLSSGLGSSLSSTPSGSYPAVERETDQKSVRQELVRQQIHMATRPLPSVPTAPGAAPSSSSAAAAAPSTALGNNNNSNVNLNISSSSHNAPRGSPRQRPSSSYQCRSLDDQPFLVSSTSSPSPLAAAAAAARQANGVSVRNSPRRKQPRPLSEIASGSGSAVVGGGSKGYDNWHPLGLYEASPLASGASVVVSGPSPKQSPRHHPHPSSSRITATPPTSSPQHQCGEGGVYLYGPTPGGVEMRAGGKGPRFESSSSSTSSSQQMSAGGVCPPPNTEPVMRYQNDSPFHAEDQEAAASGRQGLESLMCLDRSHIEDPTLRQASWYQAGIPREIALEILQQEEVGSFIIRDSSTHPGCFALSVRVPKFENSAGISHYLILKTQRGVKLKGLDKEWPTLTSLVTHHTVMPEMLPCTLRLPRNAKNLTFRQADREDPSYDDNYQHLTDITSMTGQLKL